MCPFDLSESRGWASEGSEHCSVRVIVARILHLLHRGRDGSMLLTLKEVRGPRLQSQVASVSATQGVHERLGDQLEVMRALISE